MGVQPASPADDHQCAWRQQAEELFAGLTAARSELEALRTASLEALRKHEHEIEALKRRLLGPKSEKMPTPASELRKGKPPKDPAAAQKKRRDNAAAKARLEEQRVEHPVTPPEHCPKCGAGSSFGTVGTGKETIEYEYEPGRFIRRVHVQEVKACKCGQCIVTAEAPSRVFDKCRYGPRFLAHLVVAKCDDSLPIYRLEKQFKRLDIPMARSTMNELFHRVAELLSPLHQRMLMRIATMKVVLADETSIKVHNRKKRGYVWTFQGETLIAYRFSPDRSGATPLAVLGGTSGTLVVDAYTGYNKVTDVDGRDRAGCLSHARRKFFDAKKSAPDEALEAMRQILEIYRVEHDATEQDIVRTPTHHAMRKLRSRPLMESFRAWLEEQKPRHVPKGPMGRAIGYALNNWEALTRFLDDVDIPIDNNASERALRIVALGRKNFLFVGHETAGDNLAALYSIIASCEANGLNPETYIAEMLLRIQHHPAGDIDALLPDRWKASG